MTRYLVTGGCGFIGSHLVARLRTDGHDVTMLDDLSTGSRANVPADVPLRVGSVADPALVAELMDGVDGCFHLAAIASVDRARDDWLGAHRINLGGTLTVLNAARQGPVPVVYASSAAAYGDSDALPLNEDARTRPVSAYGADKLACELHASMAGAVYGIPTVGFRFFNVYGPRQDPRSPYSGVISIFADRLIGGRPLTIHGDGEQVRDFIYVADVVDHLIAGMREATTVGPVFNVCSGRPTSVNRLARVLADLVGALPRIDHGPPRSGDIRASLGDHTKAKRHLGVECATPLEDGLMPTLDWIRRHRLIPADARPADARPADVRIDRSSRPAITSLPEIPRSLTLPSG